MVSVHGATERAASDEFHGVKRLIGAGASIQFVDGHYARMLELTRELRFPNKARGKRGIPRVIGFDEHGRERFTWGPRPGPAAELFKTRRAEGLPKSEINKELHLWYGRDRGRTVVVEFHEILQSLRESEAAASPTEADERKRKNERTRD